MKIQYKDQTTVMVGNTIMTTLTDVISKYYIINAMSSDEPMIMNIILISLFPIYVVILKLIWNNMLILYGKFTNIEFYNNSAKLTSIGYRRKNNPFYDFVNDMFVEIIKNDKDNSTYLDDVEIYCSEVYNKDIDDYHNQGIKIKIQHDVTIKIKLNNVDIKIKVTSNIEKNENKKDNYTIYGEYIPPVLTMIIFMKSKSDYDKVTTYILDKYIKYNNINDDKYKFYTERSDNSGDLRGWWKKYELMCQKTFQNTIFKKSTYNLVINKIDTWLDSKELYTTMGKPYKLGFMFYGIPGTGKSSLVLCLSHKYNMKIYNVTYKMLLKPYILYELLEDINKKGGIVLFDDIDIMVEHMKRELDDEEDSDKKEKESKKDDSKILIKENGTKKAKNDKKRVDGKKVLLKCLLELLDGYLHLNNCIVIFTTNRKNIIDEALIRPGRIDHEVEFTNCDKYQFVELAKLYKKDINKISSNHEFKLLSKKGITSAKYVTKFLLD